MEERWLGLQRAEQRGGRGLQRLPRVSAVSPEPSHARTGSLPHSAPSPAAGLRHPSWVGVVSRPAHRPTWFSRTLHLTLSPGPEADRRTSKENSDAGCRPRLPLTPDQQRGASLSRSGTPSSSALSISAGCIPDTWHTALSLVPYRFSSRASVTLSIS